MKLVRHAQHPFSLRIFFDHAWSPFGRLIRASGKSQQQYISYSRSLLGYLSYQSRSLADGHSLLQDPKTVLVVSLDTAFYNKFIYRPAWQATRPTPFRTAV
jgi:hypothetical protein